MAFSDHWKDKTIDLTCDQCPGVKGPGPPWEVFTIHLPRTEKVKSLWHLDQWLDASVMVIVWMGQWMMSVWLSVGLSWWEGLGHWSIGSINSQAEPGCCHCLDSCHANTPTTIIGALMGLSFTWERKKKGGFGGKSVCWGRYVNQSRRKQWRRGFECRG